LKVKAVTGAKS